MPLSFNLTFSFIGPPIDDSDLGSISLTDKFIMQAVSLCPCESGLTNRLSLATFEAPEPSVFEILHNHRRKRHHIKNPLPLHSNRFPLVQISRFQEHLRIFQSLLPHFHHISHLPLHTFSSQDGRHQAHHVSHDSTLAMHQRGQKTKQPETKTQKHNRSLLTPFSAAEYTEKVTNAQGPVVVDFFATWCGPCKAISPALEQMSKDNTGVSFYKVDVDELASVAAENGVSAMPTFHFYKNGQRSKEVKGANPPAIKAALEEIL